MAWMDYKIFKDREAAVEYAKQLRSFNTRIVQKRGGWVIQIWSSGNAR